MVRERVVEMPYNTTVDRVVELKTIRNKANINKEFRENTIHKHVDRRVEVPVEKYVEVPNVREIQKVVEVETKRQVTNVRERSNVKQLRKSSTRS